MRIDRLDLLRFGKFTDSSISFGELKVGQPDLHIVYGPNEAGKSTLLAAYLDFLFGFPTRTPYNFIHDNKALKVGAALTIDNELQEYRRVKKNKDSLLDGNDKPIDDRAILQKLAGLTKDSYSSMFSLDDEGLEKGGESILASEGELGQLLYSATTGVAQLSDSLLSLRASTAEFYHKDKRKHELSVLKSRLKEIEVERKEIDTEATGYKKLVKFLEEAEKQYIELDAQHDKLKSEMQQLQIKKAAAPRLVSIQSIQSKLSPLQELPEPPSSWYDDVRALQDNFVKIETRKKDLDKKIDEHSELIAKIELDENALSAQSQWQLIKDSHDQYRIACGNLPELQQEVIVCDSEIANYLRKLDKAQTEQPESLLLNTATQSNLQALIESHSPLLSQLKSAKQELALADNRSRELQERFVSEGGAVDKEAAMSASKSGASAMAELKQEVEEITNQNILVRRQSSELQLNERMDELEAAMLSLNPWRGDSQALQALTIPHDSELDALKQRRDTLRDKRSKEEHVNHTAKSQIEKLRSQHKAHATTGVVDDVESVRLREVRDKAWVEHRTSLKEDTADVFENAMRADDAGHLARLQQTEALAQLRIYSKELLIAEDSLKHSELRLAELAVEDDRLNKDLSRVIAGVSPELNSTMSIEALKSWFDAHADALQVVQKITASKREIDNIDNEALAACESLSRRLEVVSKAVDGVVVDVNKSESKTARLSGLLNAAKSLIKHDADLSVVRGKLIDSLHQSKIRKEAVKLAEQELESWTNEWDMACSSCWIGEGGNHPKPTVVKDFLIHLSALDQQLVVQTNLNKKIDGYQKTINTLGQSLGDIARDIEHESVGLSTDQLYQAIQTRMDAALDNKARVDALQAQQLEVKRYKEENDEARSVNANQIEKMCTFFSVASLAEVELKLKEVKDKVDLTERFDSVEQELLGSLQLSSISDVYEVLSGFDANQAQLDLEKLQTEAKTLETDLQRAHTSRDHARQAVENVGGDEAVAKLIEQRENVLLEIEEKATEYLQKHLALIAADAALKKYRDSHRSTMMQAASDAFSAISQGRYIGLDTVQDGSSEKLIAIDSEGKTKQSDQMSKGTRFQLYLALRVAGYHEYTRSRPAVPFIADDIMETSDDERAACTFKVLGDMAKVGQVIYLTHHQHLCEIAKSVVPGTRVHNL